jgi:hypothetical protein
VDVLTPEAAIVDPSVESILAAAGGERVSGARR